MEQINEREEATMSGEPRAEVEINVMELTINIGVWTFKKEKTKECKKYKKRFKRHIWWNVIEIATEYGRELETKMLSNVYTPCGWLTERTTSFAKGPGLEPHSQKQKLKHY